MKKSVLIFGSILFFTLVFGQDFQDEIIGSWVLVKKDNGMKSDDQIQSNPKREQFSDEPKDIEILLKFNSDNTINIKQGPREYDSEFNISEDKLLIGTTLYNINKLDSDSLIIINESGLFPITYYYLKSRL